MKLDKPAKVDGCVPETPTGQDKWVTYRSPERPEDKLMNATATAWFAALPRFLQPHHLAERFPRICNRMAERWKYPELMIPYFDDLLIDSRGGRQGFPLNIAVEIVGLKEHYLAVIADAKVNIWDRNHEDRDF